MNATDCTPDIPCEMCVQKGSARMQRSAKAMAEVANVFVGGSSISDVDLKRDVDALDLYEEANRSISAYSMERAVQ